MALFQSHSYTLPWRSVKGRSSTQVPRPRILPRQLHSGGFSTADSKGVVAVGVGLASVTLRRKGRNCSVPRVPRAAVDEQESFSELAEWLRARGAYINKAVGLVGADQGVAAASERGCVALEDIRAGELLLEIPVSCCLSVIPGSYDQVFDEELLKAVDVAGLRRQDAELALAVAVERELGEESAWWPYLKLLDCKHTFPLFYEDGDLEMLENIPLKESLAVTNRAVQLLVEKSGLADVPLRESLMLVWGRRFSCDVATGMIPLGDLLNHRFYPSCAWESPTPESPDVWKLRAKMDMAAGDSLNFCYCEDPNHLLMTTSGFVVKENPYDRIMVRPSDLRKALLSVCNEKSSEDFASWREQQIEEQLPDPEEEGVGLSMYLVGRQPGGIQWNDLWLNMIGLAVTEDPNGEHWSATPEGLQMYLAAMEKASWSLFPQSLEQDLAQGEDFADSNQEMAATMRRGYKELLKEAVDKLKDRLAAG